MVFLLFNLKRHEIGNIPLFHNTSRPLTPEKADLNELGTKKLALHIILWQHSKLKKTQKNIAINCRKNILKAKINVFFPASSFMASQSNKKILILDFVANSATVSTFLDFSPIWSGTNQKLLQQPAGRLDYTADNIFPNSPTQMLIQNWPLVGANNSSWHTVGLLDHSIENFLEPKTNNFHVIRRLLLLSIFWLTTTKCFRFHFHLPVNNWNI